MDIGNILYLLVTIIALKSPGSEAVYSLSLNGGGSYYGFVQMNINGVMNLICPGENFFDADKISKAICMEMGFEAGRQFDMKRSTNVLSWWHNTFEQETYMNPLIPKLDAFVTGSWRNVIGSGEFAYCSTKPLAVICHRRVYLTSGAYPGFGYVVISTAGSLSYIDEIGIDAVDADVICKQLGFNVSRKIDYSLMLVNSGGHETTAKSYNCAGTETSLLNCPTSDLAGGLSGRRAVISCSFSDSIPDYTVRISNHHNLVEVYHQKTWGLICGDSFSEADGLVVCKSLGSTGATSTMVPYYRVNGIYPKWINSLNCATTHDKPADCPKTGSTGQCSSVASVRCFNRLREGVYELTSGGENIFGPHFVDRTSKSEKGLLVIVSGKSSDNNEASMICRNLGHVSGFNYELPVSGLTFQNQNFWFATYNNKGSSCSTIDGCFNDDWKRVTSENSVIKNKIKMTVCHDSVKLEGNGYSGIVRYIPDPQNQNHIASLNDATLNQDEINLICKDLGFKDGGKKIVAKLYRSDRSYDIYNIDCITLATNIKNNCTFTKLNDISNIVEAAIVCDLETVLPVPDMGSFLTAEGIVHINKNQIPGRICASSDDSWNNVQASVVCRELGFNTAIPFTKRQEMDNGRSPIIFKSVSCQGNEDYLKQCELTPQTADDANCGHVAAVTCYNLADKAKFSLVDGGTRYGRVKVTKSGIEGYFCPAKFDEEDASTVCRELGFQGGDEWQMADMKTDGTVWWSLNTNCHGDSQVIENCEGTNWEYVSPNNVMDSDCYWKTAAVYCYSKVYLTQAPYLPYGAVRKTNTKIQFSSKSFGAMETKIACNEMGYPLGGKVIPSTPFKDRKLPISVSCTGNETSLLDCNAIAQQEEKKSFASVACDTGDQVPVDGTLKINDDFRVLIVKYGVWGALCGSAWTQHDANVVCQQLTGAGGKALIRGRKSKIPYANFLEAWNCVGNENKLSDCPINGTMVEEYCGDSSAAVYCDKHDITVVDKVIYPVPPGGGEPMTTTTVTSPEANDDSNTSSSTGIAVWILVLSVFIQKLW